MSNYSIEEIEELLKQELNKLVSNRISIRDDVSKYIITITDKEITVPKISSTVIRTNIIQNK